MQSHTHATAHPSPHAGMKEELITRLQNACAQRDEARAQVMELEARLQKAAADFTHQQEETQKALAAAAGAANGGAAAAFDVSGIGRMGKGASAALQQLAAQGPTMARLMAEAANSYLSPGGAGAGGAGAVGAGARPLGSLVVFGPSIERLHAIPNPIQSSHPAPSTQPTLPLHPNKNPRPQRRHAGRPRARPRPARHPRPRRVGRGRAAGDGAGAPDAGAAGAPRLSGGCAFGRAARLGGFQDWLQCTRHPLID